MEVLEAALTSPTRKKVEEKYDEGYDAEDDELYMVWAVTSQNVNSHNTNSLNTNS